jgi:hypothetical protein
MTISSRIALACVLALALAAPAIAATFTTGKYAGKTSQINKRTGKHRKITFHADSAAGQISNIKFVSTGKCSDGSRSIGSQGKNGNKLFADVDSNGDFSLFAPSKTGATKLKLKGHIEGNQASGTFSVKSRFDKDTGNPDPDGTVKCSSGTVEWSAKATG